MKGWLTFNILDGVHSYDGIQVHPDTGELVAAFKGSIAFGPKDQDSRVYADLNCLRNIISDLNMQYDIYYNQRQERSAGGHLEKITTAIILYEQCLTDIIRASAIIHQHIYSENVGSIRDKARKNIVESRKFDNAPEHSLISRSDEKRFSARS